MQDKKGDIIDTYLGNFINAHPNWFNLTLLFQRESNSHYLFGNKNVQIFLEDDELKGIHNLVLYSNTKLSILDFVDLNEKLNFTDD